MVTVKHGVDFEPAELAGRTVAEARTLYEHPFNIKPEEVAIVNGQQVAETHALKDGDKLEFAMAVVKAAPRAA